MTNFYNFPEHDIIRMLQNRDKEAFNFVYDKYAPILFGCINQWKTESDDATLILENLFVKFWQKLPELVPTKKLFCQLYSIGYLLTHQSASTDQKSKPNLHQSLLVKPNTIIPLPVAAS